jgi:hypothetical protein
MSRDEIIARIDELVAEEHGLRSRSVGNGGLSERERARLAALEVRLDQCWDLLRRRRARAEFGENPDQAQARSAGDVESYQQ